MADSKDWKKDQANRLEEQRAQELELRQLWWKAEEAKWRLDSNLGKAEGGRSWGSSSWGDERGTGWSWSSEKWEVKATPPWRSEPTAASAQSEA